MSGNRVLFKDPLTTKGVVAPVRSRGVDITPGGVLWNVRDGRLAAYRRTDGAQFLFDTRDVDRWLDLLLAERHGRLNIA